MPVIARKRKSGTVYYAKFSWQGKDVWEHSGSDRREAVRLLTRRQGEVARGMYLPESENRATSVGQYAREWLDGRTNRIAESDRSRLQNYVLTKPWFQAMPLTDVKPKHMMRLVTELKATIGIRTKRPLAPKTVGNTFALLKTMFRDAQIQELIGASPCVLPRGLISQKSVVRREPYEAGDVGTLLQCSEVEEDKRVFAALVLLTGMRAGEACGRRWRDWDRAPKPLGALHVTSQFDGQPLKTDRLRVVPVHPLLAQVLAWWWSEGFELVYLRKPRSDDFIVPMRRVFTCHTNSSSWKMLRTACKRSGVKHRDLHSTRHTFISLTRRGGARKDVVEKLTHNARGDVLDTYTSWDWQPLCEAVLCITLAELGGDAKGDALATALDSKWSRGGSNPKRPSLTSTITAKLAEPPPESHPVKTPKIRRVTADLTARHPWVPLAADWLTQRRLDLTGGLS